MGSKHIWYITSQDEVIVGSGIEIVNQLVAPVQIGSLCETHIQISTRNLLKEFSYILMEVFLSMLIVEQSTNRSGGFFDFSVRSRHVD